MNQQSYIVTQVSFSDQADSQSLGGEYIKNDWVISVSTSVGNTDSASVGVGHFITQDFKISVYSNAYDDAEGLFDADKSDFSTLVTKHYTALGEGSYLSLAAQAVVYGDEFSGIEDTVSLNAEYYISPVHQQLGNAIG